MHQAGTMICHQWISKSSSSFRIHALFHYTWQNTGLSVTRLIDSHKSDFFPLLIIQKNMIPMCKLLLLTVYKNFQILTQLLCCQNCSQSMPANLKWTAQELLSCKHSLRAPTYWSYANGRLKTGSLRLACAGIIQNLFTDIKKKTLQKSRSWDAGMLSPPSSLPQATHFSKAYVTAHWLKEWMC